MSVLHALLIPEKIQLSYLDHPDQIPGGHYERDVALMVMLFPEAWLENIGKKIFFPWVKNAESFFINLWRPDPRDPSIHELNLCIAVEYPFSVIEEFLPILLLEATPRAEDTLVVLTIGGSARFKLGESERNFMRRIEKFGYFLLTLGFMRSADPVYYIFGEWHARVDRMSSVSPSRVPNLRQGMFQPLSSH